MWREWSGACVKGRGVLENGGWGIMKLRAVALWWRFKVQSNETHCSLRICCIPYLWIVWSPVLRACCGSMTGKDNCYRMMASYQAQVYVGTLCLQAQCHRLGTSQNKRTSSHLFASVCFSPSHTPGKLSHWHHWEEHTFCMREVSILIPLCSLSITFIPSNYTRQEGRKFKIPFLSASTSESIKELIVCRVMEQK